MKVEKSNFFDSSKIQIGCFPNKISFYTESNAIRAHERTWNHRSNPQIHVNSTEESSPGDALTQRSRATGLVPRARTATAAAPAVPAPTRRLPAPACFSQPRNALRRPPATPAPTRGARDCIAMLAPTSIALGWLLRHGCRQPATLEGVREEGGTRREGG